MRNNGRLIVFWSFTIILGSAVVMPLCLLVLNSFRHVGIGELSFSFSKFTLNNYIEAYSHPATFKMLLNSFLFSIGSMLVSFFFGASLAFLSERTDLRFRAAIPFIVMIPLVIPSIVKGIAWLFLLTPRVGLMNILLKELGFETFRLNAYSLPAMIWVEGISMSTLAYLLIGAVLRQMDPALEEAALGSGATVWRVVYRVTIPLLGPGLAGAGILLFIRGMETFEVPMLLGFSRGIFVFSTNIYYSLRSAFPPDYGLGFAYSMGLVTLTVFSLLIYQRMFKRAEQYTVVTGKGYKPRLIKLGTWKYAAWGMVGFYLLFAILFPLFILIWASFLPFFRPPSAAAMAILTLENYTNLLRSDALVRAVKNTLILGGISSVCVMFLSLLSSLFVYRTNIAGRKALDFIIFLPYAVSGMVVGVAFMIVFLSFPNPIYNTIWIIVLAYTINYLPIGTRFTNAAIVQIHKELDEAAMASGSNFWTRLFRIWLPLLAPGLINGFLFVLILSFKVMSIAVLLQGPDNMILSVYLWRLWDSGSLGAASALSVVLVFALGTLTVATRWLSRGSQAV
ncbi:MAG: iron ABC transporter permease [Desulfobacterales bacterium]|nr:iron ABC transporter permease [Desulfobacterales bacterium]